MGNRKALLPLSMCISAVSEVTGMLTYVFIWLIVKGFFDTHGNGTPAETIPYAGWAAGLAVGSVVLYYLALMCSHLAAFRVESNLRKEAMRQIVRMPLGFFDLNTSGKIRKVIDDNAGITHSFLAHQMPDLAGSVLVPLTAVILIFAFDWKLGLVCIIPVAVAMFLMGHLMNTQGQAFMRAYMTSLEEMNTEAVEYVRGIPVIKVFQQTIYSFKNFHKSIMAYNQMASSYTGLWEKPMSCYTIIINSFVFFLAPTVILIVSHDGDYASALLNFFLFVLITPLFSQSIMKSMHLSEALGQAGEAIGRLERLLEYKPLSQPEKPEKPTAFDVCYDHVSFSYPGATQKAVDGISFSIPQGKKVALVGASGGGKTTIARLLPRFWDADEGEIRIGHVNIKHIAPENLMQHVSFVFQNPHLLKTTLRENLKCGNPEAREEEINRALDLAQCREIIDRLPKGLNTKIGTEGTYLSGGERQRIALARAILKNASIIVLDEATAYADPENEHLIQQALRELTARKTVLTIAHRLSSITDADRILVIDKGRIVEQGTHEELLKQNGIYKTMWNEYQQSVSWTIGKEVHHA